MFLKLFGDKDGNVSSMNFVWVLSILIIIGTWICLSIKLNTLQHVTAGDALWFTTLFSGKALQNFFERKYPSGTTKELGMFEDNNGQTSIARIIWVISILGIVSTWSFISWKAGQLQHFSTGDAAWFAGLFGSKIGGTIVDSELAAKKQDKEKCLDDEKYKGSYGDGDGDGDYPALGMPGFSSEVSNAEKDSLIKQLQETIRVQTQFNKNLVGKIDPTINIKQIEDDENNVK